MSSRRMPMAESSARSRPVLIVSAGETGWQSMPIEAGDAGNADIEVYASVRGPILEGFGGAFNEKGWAALSVLTPEARTEVLSKIFKAGDGLGLNVGRIPIGSSDYAMERYSYNEHPGDFEMKHFSIDRDRKMLLPYVRAAKALRPDITFWASPWSPPTWMKDNNSFDTGNMLDDENIYAAYAKYLAEFAEAWEAEGFPIVAIAVQNEPINQPAYPSCGWKPEQYRTFIRDHMGPEFERRRTRSAIMLGTLNVPENVDYALTVLRDPEARKYVSILGLQWSGLPIAEHALKEKPDLRVWMTEADCGNWHWKETFNPDRPQNDFEYAAYTWKWVRDYLAGDSTLYCLWNIVLDETGKSIDAKRPWPQNSPIVVNSTSKQVTYTPMFYAFGHFSRYSPAGSRRLAMSGGYEDAIAFRNPEGETVIHLLNSGREGKKLKVKASGRYWDLTLGGQSFATLIV